MSPLQAVVLLFFLLSLPYLRFFASCPHSQTYFPLPQIGFIMKYPYMIYETYSLRNNNKINTNMFATQPKQYDIKALETLMCPFYNCAPKK